MDQAAEKVVDKKVDDTIDTNNNQTTGTNDHKNYEVQLLLNSSFITLKTPGYSQDQVVKLANTIPVADIAKLLQVSKCSNLMALDLPLT